MNLFKRKPKLRLERVNNGILPQYAHNTDAGMDCYSNDDDIKLTRGSRVLVHLGFKSQFSKNYELQIRPKSGLAYKHGITVLNSPGTIDAGYRDEVCAIIVNKSNRTYTIKKGQKICQAVFARVEHPRIIEKAISNKDNRGGGFGSTGI